MPHVVSFLVTMIAFLGMRNITSGVGMAAVDDGAIRFTFFSFPDMYMVKLAELSFL